MSLQKITEVSLAALTAENPNIYVEQDGVFNRVALDAILQKIKDSCVTTEKLNEMLPDLVKSIIPSTDGTSLTITYWDDTTQTVEVSGSGGLAFDSMLYDEDGYLHIQMDGEDVVDPVFISGGGGSAGAIMRLQNLMDGLSIHIMDGESAIMRFKFTSTEDDSETGPGTAQYYVGGILRATETIQQGENSWDCTKYLTAGESNMVKITVTDNYGTSRSLNYTVTSITIYHTDTFDPTLLYAGDVVYRFIAYGSVAKTFHATLDGVEVATMEIASSGRQTSVTLPRQVHGSHMLKTWLTTDVGGLEVKGNVITHDVMWQADSNMTPIIASPFEQSSAIKGEAIVVPYIAVDPASTQAAVSLRVNGTEVAALSVDRTLQEWTITDYPTGEVVFSIVCGITEKSFTVNVAESTVDVSVTESGAMLMLSAAGRSNSETPEAIAAWPSKVGDVTATLTDFTYRTNGWMGKFLRVFGAARVTIPFKPFAEDFRGSGRTIEFDVAFKNIQDKNAPAISCMSGGIGMEISAHTATLASEQAKVSATYGGNQRLRIAFAVESKAESRIIRTYVNGYVCGAQVYPATDNFAQATPVDIVIGSDYCTVDVYGVNVYDHGLTQYELMDNFIATRDTNAEKQEIYYKNQVYTASGDISFEKVAAMYPAMVIIGELPKFKGDKKKVTIKFFNPDDPEKNFVFENVTIDVQGTSSQYYPVKNLKIKPQEVYILIDGLPEKVFCLKANYMDSSGKRNTGTANLLQSMYTEKTPPQMENDKLRTTVEGYSIVVFHAPTEVDTPVFAGLYDFNLDKDCQSSFGFTDPAKHQCWEVCNNTSPRCLFQSADFSTGDVGNDFEARYPEDCTDYGALERFVKWVVSCKGDPDKFRAEQPQHINKHYLVVYCIMAKLLTMCDSLAKNLFVACWSVGEAIEIFYTIFYDMDSIIRLNNEGVNAFEPGHDYWDTIGTKNVFNGADSVLFQLAVSAFAEDIAAEYRSMRNDGRLSVDRLMQFYNMDKVSSCMALYNADGEFKYVQPLLTSGDGTYLYAYQGNGDAYFREWLTESIASMDSEYEAAEFNSDYVTMRIYTPDQYAGVEPNADMHLTRSAPGYSRVKYGSYKVGQRAAAGEEVLIEAPDIRFNDTETIAGGARYLRSIGNLAPLYPGTLDLHMAVSLAEIIAGSAADGYRNTNLTELIVGNNPELLRVNVQGCPALGGTLELAGCENIRQVYGAGTALSGVTLPNGGYLDTLQMEEPTSLIIRNHATLETLDIKSYAKLSTLWMEGKSKVDVARIVKVSPALARVRLLNMELQMEDEDILIRISGMAGLDENGNNTDLAVVTGKAYLETTTEKELESIASTFPNLMVTYGTIVPYITVTFANYDGTTLNTQSVRYGRGAVNPVTAGLIDTPFKPPAELKMYIFTGWDCAFDHVTEDITVTAVYVEADRTCTVRWWADKDKTALLQTDVVPVNGYCHYKGADLPDLGKSLWLGWDKLTTFISDDMDIFPVYAVPSLPDVTPEEYDYLYSDDPADNSAFSIGEFLGICQSGQASTYFKVSDKVKIMLPSNAWKTLGDTPIVMQVYGFNHFKLADGSGEFAKTVFGTLGVPWEKRMNPTSVNAGGWYATELRNWLNETVFPLLPVQWRKMIKIVEVISTRGESTTSTITANDKLFLFSWTEATLGSGAPYGDEVAAGAETKAFPIFTDNASRVKKKLNGAGPAVSWWLRSPYPSSSSSFCGVNSSGIGNSNFASYSYGVVFGFCI